MVQHRGRQSFQAEVFGDFIVGKEQIHKDAITQALPAPPEEWAIEGLLEVPSNTMLVADAKAGKTTIAMQMVKSLLDGEPFLGQFDVEPPDGKILYLNYELDERKWDKWVRKLGFKNIDGLLHTHLKRGAMLPFSQDSAMEEFAEGIAEQDVWLIVIDTQAMASQTMVQNENDNIQMASFYSAIERLLGLAGVSNCFVIHHIGKADRSNGRGASFIQGWPDAIWRMREVEEGSTDREFKAFGRDIDLEPCVLNFDKKTGLYSWSGQTPRESKHEQTLISWLQALLSAREVEGAWPTAKQAQGFLQGDNNKKKEFIISAERQGYVKRQSRLPVGTSIVVTKLGRQKAGR